MACAAKNGEALASQKELLKREIRKQKSRDRPVEKAEELEKSTTGKQLGSGETAESNSEDAGERNALDDARLRRRHITQNRAPVHNSVTECVTIARKPCASMLRACHGSFGVGASLSPMDMDIKELNAIFTPAELITFIHIAAASRTDEGAGLPWVLNIDSVPAHPTFVHLDVAMVVTDHVSETTLFTYHRSPLLPALLPPAPRGWR